MSLYIYVQFTKLPYPHEHWHLQGLLGITWAYNGHIMTSINVGSTCVVRLVDCGWVDSAADSMGHYSCSWNPQAVQRTEANTLLFLSFVPLPHRTRKQCLGSWKNVHVDLLARIQTYPGPHTFSRV